MGIIIVVFQVVIYLNTVSKNDISPINNNVSSAILKKLDSLQRIELEKRKPKIFPFNPNYISDYSGEKLGMSTLQIDRLLEYRSKGKFINSVKEFQQVTNVSDSLLKRISSKFKFPSWVLKRNTSLKKQTQKNIFVEKKRISTSDINKATKNDFQTISGIGPTFSDRIIKYRSKLQGFTFGYQLYEVFNIDSLTVKKLLKKFVVVAKPIIVKQNVNTVEFRELLKNPYIDYELCKKIFNYRDEVAELQNISELKEIEDFPLDKYERIVLYLVAE